MFSPGGSHDGRPTDVSLNVKEDFTVCGAANTVAADDASIQRQAFGALSAGVSGFTFWGLADQVSAAGIVLLLRYWVSTKENGEHQVHWHGLIHVTRYCSMSGVILHL